MHENEIRPKGVCLHQYRLISTDCLIIISHQLKMFKKFISSHSNDIKIVGENVCNLIDIHGNDIKSTNFLT